MSNINNAINYYYNLIEKTKNEEERVYALLALTALEHRKEYEPVPSGKYGFSCPRCKSDLGVDREDINIFDILPPHNCNCCGQALTWTRFMTMTGQARMDKE